MTVTTLPSLDLIGKSVPSNLRLKDILKTLPQACFQKNSLKAWSAVATNILMVILGYAAIALAPWFLLPFAWFFTGTALTGFFVIGHDCGHRSFAKRRWVNNLVGHLAFLPLIYPFHAWRILHNRHHKHTNKMDVDNAWQPFRPELYSSMDVVKRSAYQLMRGRLWWLASTLHWALLHFDWRQFQGKERQQVRLSVLVAVGFAAIALPLLVATTGIVGLIKFWLLPWLMYHFWMSTFTLVHHTFPDIPFTEPVDWNEAEAQLTGTVHCEYPAGVEFLCHHINVHIPHHISTSIPSYNLRMAHNSLRENWGAYLRESRFDWQLMQKITDQCHLYEPQNFYQSFRQFHRQ